MSSMTKSFKIKSKAFRRGFLQGLTSPVLLFKDNEYVRANGVDATLDSAWKGVENALAESIKHESVCVQLAIKADNTRKENKRLKQSA